MWRNLRLMLVFLASGVLALAPGAAVAGPGGTLQLEVVDQLTRRPLACRMHLANAGGQPLKAPRVPFWHDHFVFDGTIALKLPKGQYNFVIERGLEYEARQGHFAIEEFSKDTQTIELARFADMAAEGWWSGDLDVARPAADLELLMKADDLHVAELITWPRREVLLSKGPPGHPLVRFDENRYYHLSAGIDARGGGVLLFYNLDTPLDLGGARDEAPPQQESIAAAKRQPGAWVDARSAYGWDVPSWVAGGQLDSVQIANSNLRRGEVATSERQGKPRDELAFPGTRGNGRWSQAIYFHLLNCGLRIPPTAGSGSGEVANPLGYNRMYVHVDGDFSYQVWWQGLRAGRVVVTNGPLLRPIVEGEVPGYVFRAAKGQVVELEVALTLSTQDPVSTIEVIKDGRVEHSTPFAEYAAAGGRLPPVVFHESGWMLIRAECDVPGTYRYGMTAPYYVEIGDQPRVSKQSAQFFLDWVNERLSSLKRADPDNREQAIEYQRQAQAYWQQMVERANAP